MCSSFFHWEQLQIQRTTSIKPSKITKIFITHAHGDHSFGLPGLLCVMGNGNQNRDMNLQQNRNPGNTNEVQPIEIYGPEGLRMWLRVAIRYSVSRIVPPYVVHELMDVPMAPEWEFNRRYKRYYYNGFQHQQQQKQQDQNSNNDNNNRSSSSKGQWGLKRLGSDDGTSWISQSKVLQIDPSPLYGEMDGGRNIYPDYNHPKSNDGAPVWTVIDDETVTVYAAPMSHTIPCVGYCIEEAPRPGRLRNEHVEPIVQRNLDLLRVAGLKNPMKVMGILKNLKQNTAFTFPDGTIVTQNDAVEAARKGRKVVICGDTCDSRAMITLAKDADVVVHEATNSYLPGVDTKRDVTYNDVTRDCIIHGHSTPQMAGDFCRKVNGKQLVLNHFSARYKGDISPDSLSIMMRIEKLGMQTSGLDESNIAAAWDFMILPIQQHE
jgi:ribonuclease Z